MLSCQQCYNFSHDTGKMPWKCDYLLTLRLLFFPPVDFYCRGTFTFMCHFHLWKKVKNNLFFFLSTLFLSPSVYTHTHVFWRWKYQPIHTNFHLHWYSLLLTSFLFMCNVIVLLSPSFFFFLSLLLLMAIFCCCCCYYDNTFSFISTFITLYSAQNTNSWAFWSNLHLTFSWVSLRSSIRKVTEINFRPRSLPVYSLPLF